MGAVTFEPRAVGPNIRDAVSGVVWRTRGLDCHAVDLLLFWRRVSGRMERTLILPVHGK